MHLVHITQRIIQNRNVHISVLHGAMWNIEQVHSEIYGIAGGMLYISLQTHISITCIVELNVLYAQLQM